MTRLGAVMSEAIVHHYGRNELLRRLAHPRSLADAHAFFSSIKFARVSSTAITPSGVIGGGQAGYFASTDRLCKRRPRRLGLPRYRRTAFSGLAAALCRRKIHHHHKAPATPSSLRVFARE